MSILNINGGGGGTYIRFMPSLNAWVFNKEEVALEAIVFDLDTIKSGWGKMAEGLAPEWSWDERLGVKGPMPSPEHKRGFAISFFAKGIGTVEWSSTGTGPVIGFDAIFDQVWQQKDANPGKVPVVKYTGSSPLKVGKGSTRTPNFTLVKWAAKDSVPWEKAPEAAARAPKPAAAPTAVDDDISFN